ncbi:molybdopterin molybdenumtransferase MoeA [Actinomyces sp. HMSC06A08]|nr:molybdopterin molybdenumtransferase MoeA [Actinomyces sp. HMSC06A08]
MKDVAAHYRDVLQLGQPLPPQTVPVEQALGRVLAQDTPARYSVPPFTNSAMDGFAVRAEDVQAGCTLPVSTDIHAGRTDPLTLEAGTAMRIMTGAPLPSGANAVVQVELTENADQNMAEQAPAQVTFSADVAAGANVRRAGEDINAGETLFQAGTRLSAAHLSALVAVGYGQVQIRPGLRVGVVTTGEELRPAGEQLKPGQIPDSNSVLVASLAAEAGASAHLRAFHADTVEGFLADLDAAAREVDLLITTGGVSAGAFDVVKAALRQKGVTFTKVAMQPGKPQGFGQIRANGRDVPILCLPGNPVSVLVSWYLFAVPLIHKLEGQRPAAFDDRFTRAEVGTGWKRKTGRVQFLPATAREGENGLPSAEVHVHPASHGGSKSHFVASLAAATGLVRIPADQAEVKVGEEVPVMWFGRPR